MDKLLLYPQNNGDRRDIFFVKEDRHYLQKHASGYHPVVQKYINEAKPMPGLIQVLLTALGAGEFWGANVNSDFFPQKSLEHEGADYGYQTFLTNANYFTHHVNKDPALAKGKVLLSVWNDGAKRVELIVGINPELDPDAGRQIDSGEPLTFSMGAKLPFDTCSVCGNNARTRAEYCDHLKYQLGQIDSGSGRLVFAYNHFPKFFDISRVLIPADKTAFMWTKVAGAAPLMKLGSAELAQTPAGLWTDPKYIEERAYQNKHASSMTSTASVAKSAEIKKQIPVEMDVEATKRLNKAFVLAKQALDASAPDIPQETFAGHTLGEILSTMLYLGMVPKGSEAAGLWNTFVGEGGKVSMASCGPENFSVDLAEKLAPFIEKRSFVAPILVNRMLALETPALKKEAMSDTGAGLAAGAAAALTAILSGSSSGIMKFVSNHPFIAAILLGTGIKMMRTAGGPGSKLTSGNFTVADPTRGFYNNDWQRRFIDLQSRPVAVIKTGAALNYDAFLTPASVAIMFADLADSGMAATGFIKEASADTLSYIKEITPYCSDLLKQAQMQGMSSNLEDPELIYRFPEVTDMVIVKKALQLKDIGG